MARKRQARAALLSLWLAACGLDAWAGEFVVFEDAGAGKLLKGPLDSSSWQPVGDFVKGRNTWTLLAGGRQLAILDRAAGKASITVYDLASARPVMSQQLPPSTVVAGPVFGNPSLYLLRTFDLKNRSDGHKAFIADLKAGSVVGTVPSGGIDTTISPLPDGRLYRIHDTTGVISVSGSDGAWAPIGRLAIPAHMKIAGWRLNHRGTQVAVHLSWTASSSDVRSDIWIANADGSSPYRLTRQGQMGRPVWSPDDSRVAFLYDTLSSLAGGGLDGAGTTGRCSYWHVPVEARDVGGLSFGRPHAIAHQMHVNYGGVKNYPACNVLAWERD